jgi:hypothetical protein
VNTNENKCEENKVRWYNAVVYNIVRYLMSALKFQIERRTRSMSREERSSHNGFSDASDNECAPERRKTNLVRLSSWSDRKKPDIEIRRRLPSVKELAKQFSGESNTCDVSRKLRGVEL